MLNCSQARHLLQFMIVVLAVAAIAVAAPTTPASATGNPNPGVLPPESHPFGKTYGEWQAEWSKWLHRVPVAVNPWFDTTGENCHQGQQGKVWFLMGIPGGSEPRHCSVPKGRAIFVPIQSSMWWNWTTDPPAPHTPEFEAYVRDLLSPALEDHGLYASVDGVEITDLTAYAHESPVFFSVVPDDNIIDWTAGGYSDWKDGDVSGPHYDAGVYIMLAPLPPGEHEISTSGWDGGWAGTWIVTVE